jgi:hypothetical protein
VVVSGSGVAAVTGSARHRGWVAFAAAYLLALDCIYELYQQTGRKLVVANFVNVILGVVAPTARLLMRDISSCDGGRCSFVVDTYGDLFPSSEFRDLVEFQGATCSPVAWRVPLPRMPSVRSPGTARRKSDGSRNLGMGRSSRRCAPAEDIL